MTSRPVRTLSRRSKAIALVPLALLSGVWTASLVSASATASDTDDGDGALPDGTQVPDQRDRGTGQRPGPRRDRPGRPRGLRRLGRLRRLLQRHPGPGALAAYQRGAQIINAADKSCNIPWELIAAIGRVESDHGRYGGNTLTDERRLQARHLRHRPERQERHPGDQRHRRRPARQGHRLRPCGRPDAVHPLDLAGRQGRRRRRRPAQPAGHRRRRPRDRRLPLLRQGQPLHPHRPGSGGLPLQPQPGLREPRAADHGGLLLR